jgi:hypothetical protein
MTAESVFTRLYYMKAYFPNFCPKTKFNVSHVSCQSYLCEQLYNKPLGMCCMPFPCYACHGTQWFTISYKAWYLDKKTV